MGHREYLDGVQAQTRLVATGSISDYALPIISENDNASRKSAPKRQFQLQLLFKCELGDLFDTALHLEGIHPRASSI